MRKLSIIVPIYYVEKYLRRCLDSLVGQTYPNLEIVLVDDGSPDQCGAIADEYAAKDSRIAVIHKPNGGLSTAWNCGLDRATGDYLTFVDSDDWVDRDYYERIFGLMGDQDYDVFMSNGRIIEMPDGTSREAHTFSEPFFMGRERTKEDLLRCTLARTRSSTGETYHDLGVVWDKLYRTALIQKHRLRVTTSSVAKCAWTDALFVYQVISHAESIRGECVVGYHYRVIASSATKKYNPDLADAYAAFFDELENVGGGYAGRVLRQAVNQRALGGLSDCMRRSWFHPKNEANRAALAREIRRVKNLPCFYQAIHSNDNEGILKKFVLLRYALKLPFVWPLRLLEKANQLKNKVSYPY